MKLATWTGGALICLAGLLLYGFGTNNPNALRWFVFSGAAVLSLGYWTWQGNKLTNDKLVWAVLAFVGYAALSLAWSADWREGIQSLNQLTMLVIIGLALLHVERDLLIKSVPAFATAGIGIELFTSFNVTSIFGGLGNENFQCELLVIIAPLAFMSVVVCKHPALKVLGAIAGLVALSQAVFFNASDAKWAGFSGIGGLVIIALFTKRWWTTASCAVLLSAAGIAAVFNHSIATSFRERFELGYNTLMMWKDSPIFGVGLGSYNYKYPFYQESHIGWQATRVVRSVHNYAGAAHNEFIQALAVFGLVGIALLTLIAWLAYMRRQDDLASWFGAASLFAFFGLSLVGFPAQNPTTAILGVIALAIVTKASNVPQNIPYHWLPSIFRRSAVPKL